MAPLLSARFWRKHKRTQSKHHRHLLDKEASASAGHMPTAWRLRGRMGCGHAHKPHSMQAAGPRRRPRARLTRRPARSWARGRGRGCRRGRRRPRLRTAPRSKPAAGGPPAATPTGAAGGGGAPAPAHPRIPAHQTSLSSETCAWSGKLCTCLTGQIYYSGDQRESSAGDATALPIAACCTRCRCWSRSCTCCKSAGDGG